MWGVRLPSEHHRFSFLAARNCRAAPHAIWLQLLRACAPRTARAFARSEGTSTESELSKKIRRTLSLGITRAMPGLELNTRGFDEACWSAFPIFLKSGVSSNENAFIEMSFSRTISSTRRQSTPAGH